MGFDKIKRTRKKRKDTKYRNTNRDDEVVEVVEEERRKLPILIYSSDR